MENELEWLREENDRLKEILHSTFTSTNFCQITKQECSNPLARHHSCSQCRWSEYDD